MSQAVGSRCRRRWPAFGAVMTSPSRARSAVPLAARRVRGRISPRSPAGSSRSAEQAQREIDIASSASSAARPRGTTTTGTGEWRTIFDAREPRNTRAIGPIELEPTTSTSPSSQSTWSSASSQLSPWPITASSSAGAAGRSATFASAALPAARISSVHWAISDASGPRADARRVRRARAHGERGQAQRRADPGGHARGRDHEVLRALGESRRHARHARVRPAAVAARRQRDRDRRAVQQPRRRAAERHRSGAGRSTTSRRRAGSRRAPRRRASRPAGAERAWRTTVVAGMSSGSRSRACSSASFAACSRYAWYSASTRAGLGGHGAGITAQSTRSSPDERASIPARCEHRAPRPSGAKPTIIVMALPPARPCRAASGACRRRSTRAARPPTSRRRRRSSRRGGP